MAWKPAYSKEGNSCPERKNVVGVIAGLLAVILLVAETFFLRMRQMMASMGPVEQTYTHENHGSNSGSVIYMTTDISSEGLMVAYEALNWAPTGKVAVKLSTPASNYLDPNLIKNLVQLVDGTIVENNIASQSTSTLGSPSIPADNLQPSGNALFAGSV